MFGRKSLTAQNSELREENRKLRQEVLNRDRKLEKVANDPLSKMMDNLPEGVFIKRIIPRSTEYKWLVHFRRGGTEYYGITLEEALTELFAKNSTVRDRYLKNLSAGQGNK